MVIVSKEQMRDVKLAKWEGFKRLAKQLPNHHILSVELIRTSHDETAAVFTVVKHHEPIQYVVVGDAHGKVKASYHAHALSEAGGGEKAALEVKCAADDPSSPDGMALGGPPPKQPPPPGLLALGGCLLATAFEVGELLPDVAAK